MSFFINIEINVTHKESNLEYQNFQIWTWFKIKISIDKISIKIQ